MHAILKKGIAGLLLLLLFYNFGGYLFVFKIQDSLNRTAIEQQLNCNRNSQLLKITDPHQLVRLSNHEIIYQKQRYDVSKEFIKDGYLHFYCIHDQEEESLIAGLKDFVLHTMDVPVQKHHGSGPDYSKNPVKEFYAATKDFLFLHEAQDHTTTSFLSFSLADVKLKITSPPPKTLL
jgi:hypothetical protein